MLSEIVVAAHQGVDLAQRGIREGKVEIADVLLDGVRRHLVQIGAAIAGTEPAAVRLPVGVPQPPANDAEPVLLLDFAEPALEVIELPATPVLAAMRERIERPSRLDAVKGGIVFGLIVIVLPFVALVVLP